MSTLRAESQQPRSGRARSGTGQSIHRPLPPPIRLKDGDFKVLNSWVHDAKESANVIVNQALWPGVAEGDVLRVVSSNAEDRESGFLFIVPKDEGCAKTQLQVRYPSCWMMLSF
jgi:hypothetical protein